MDADTLEEFRSPLPGGGWTTDDLDELPEDGIRRELIDGVLIVYPSPTNVHQHMTGQLCVALDETCPPEYDVTFGVEVRINERRSLIPDVLATTAEAAARGPSKFHPHEVVLAVEVVSPWSRSFDRITKPALYGEAGIPFYWRIETKGELVVYTHRLTTHGVYEQTGKFADTIVVDEPWEIEIAVSRLVPSFLVDE